MIALCMLRACYPFNLCDPMNWSLPGFSVHGIRQAGILQWIPMPSARRPSRPKDWTPASCLLHCRQVLYSQCHWDCPVVFSHSVIPATFFPSLSLWAHLCMSQGSLSPPTWIGDGETCNKRRLCFLACVTTFHFHNSPIGRAEWPHQIEESDLDLEGLDALAEIDSYNFSFQSSRKFG